MGYKHQYVDVRISRRTLWVGSQAYPLHAIARVRGVEYVPQRRPAVWAFVRKAAAWFAIGLAGLVALGCLGESAPVGAYVALVLAVLGMLTWHTVRLVRALAEPNLYALFVETASPNMALVSRNGTLIQDLVERIVAAIDNPALEFAMKVEHIYGDKVTGDKFTGNKYGGDQVAGNKIIP